MFCDKRHEPESFRSRRRESEWKPQTCRCFSFRNNIEVEPSTYKVSRIGDEPELPEHRGDEELQLFQKRFGEAEEERKQFKPNIFRNEIEPEPSQRRKFKMDVERSRSIALRYGIEPNVSRRSRLGNEIKSERFQNDIWRNGMEPELSRRSTFRNTTAPQPSRCSILGNGTEWEQSQRSELKQKIDPVPSRRSRFDNGIESKPFRRSSFEQDIEPETSRRSRLENGIQSKPFRRSSFEQDIEPEPSRRSGFENGIDFEPSRHSGLRHEIGLDPSRRSGFENGIKSKPFRRSNFEQDIEPEPSRRSRFENEIESKPFRRNIFEQEIEPEPSRRSGFENGINFESSRHSRLRHEIEPDLSQPSRFRHRKKSEASRRSLRENEVQTETYRYSILTGPKRHVLREKSIWENEIDVNTRPIKFCNRCCCFTNYIKPEQIELCKDAERKLNSTPYRNCNLKDEIIYAPSQRSTFRYLVEVEPTLRSTSKSEIEPEPSRRTASKYFKYEMEPENARCSNFKHDIEQKSSRRSRLRNDIESEPPAYTLRKEVSQKPSERFSFKNILKPILSRLSTRRKGAIQTSSSHISFTDDVEPRTLGKELQTSQSSHSVLQEVIILKSPSHINAMKDNKHKNSSCEAESNRKKKENTSMLSRRINKWKQEVEEPKPCCYNRGLKFLQVHGFTEIECKLGTLADESDCMSKDQRKWLKAETKARKKAAKDAKRKEEERKKAIKRIKALAKRGEPVNLKASGYGCIASDDEDAVSLDWVFKAPPKRKCRDKCEGSCNLEK